jgi:hypothetical protein
MFLLCFCVLAEEKKPRSCVAQQTTVDGKTYWWHTHTTDDKGTKLLSIRYGNEIDKVLKDCAKFLKKKRDKP